MRGCDNAKVRHRHPPRTLRTGRWWTFQISTSRLYVRRINNRLSPVK
nr:MAG TPA: hypothetical protein [Caudoviricetes sp.]